MAPMVTEWPRDQAENSTVSTVRELPRCAIYSSRPHTNTADTEWIIFYGNNNTTWQFRL